MDADFKVSGHRLTKLTNAQSYSLFKRPSNNVFDLQKNINLMLSVWRLRTYDFMSKGVFKSNPVKVQYLRNCPPSLGFYSGYSSGLRYCKFYSCPWCWNRRYCSNIFKKIDRTAKTYQDVKFYMFVKEESYSKKDYKKAPKLLTARCENVNILCRKLIRRLSVKGGAAHSYLEPSLDGFNLVTKLTLATTKPVEFDESFVFKFCSVNCSKLSSNFGSYPLSFVKRGIALKGFSYFLSNIPKNHRRLVLFGSFYGKKEKKHVR
jgi:hypothetical protein